MNPLSVHLANYLKLRRGLGFKLHSAEMLLRSFIRFAETKRVRFITTKLSELLQAYFTQRLMHECNASPHTIANYRDTFRLLIRFADRNLKKPPTALAMQDLDAAFVCRFLDHLEKDRGVGARSRNVRLAAIHSFFHYVALQEPALGALAQRVLAIKNKRHTKKPIDFLTRTEAEALLSAPNQQTWSGRRDHALLLLALQTGLRLSEIIGLRCRDITLDSGPHVRCTGKGRKSRCVPLRKETVTTLRAWLRERNAQPGKRDGWHGQENILPDSIHYKTANWNRK